MASGAKLRSDAGLPPGRRFEETTMSATRPFRTRLACAAGLAAAMLLPGAAHAVAITYGTAEYVTIRDCTVAGASGCDEISPILQGSYGGLPGSTSSTAFTTLAGYGTAAGSVSLSGTVGAPVLRAAAIAEPGKRTNTNSVALQRYTYTGTTSTVRHFGGTLTYSQDVTGPYPDGVGSGISAAIDIFTTTAASIEVGDTAATNFQTLFAVSGEAGYASLGSDTYTDVLDNPAGVGALDVAVTLNPGDSVWVWVLLQTPAASGGFIDASSTLITGWDIATDLVAAGAVPVPPTLALSLASLALLGAVRRRG
jgi:hypothetical protein